jgi:hypothetical protein
MVPPADGLKFIAFGTANLFVVDLTIIYILTGLSGYSY